MKFKNKETERAYQLGVSVVFLSAGALSFLVYAFGTINHLLPMGGAFLVSGLFGVFASRKRRSGR